LSGEATRGAALITLIGFLADQYYAVAQFHPPAGYRTQCGRPKRLAGSQTEAGMVPGAPHRVLHHEAFRERSAVMRTGRTDCKEVVAAACEEHGISPT
jgi:hypothetical protein